MNGTNLIIFLLGFAVAVFSHPRVMRFFMSRVINEGLVTPKIVKPENGEIVKYMGPHLSLLLIGCVLMLISVILAYA